MRTLGLVGGLGPESTVDYYRRVFTAYCGRTRDGSAPRIVVDSVDMKKMLALADLPESRALTDYLLASIERLARAGAGFAALAASTPHAVFPELRDRAPIPMLSLVESACRAAQQRGLRRLGLLGTRYTMRGRFFREVFERAGLAIVTPAPEEQAYVHDKYMSELVAGVLLDNTRQRIIAIVERLRSEESIDGVVLGGTELPLLLREPTVDEVPCLDTTGLHVGEIVEEILRESELSVRPMRPDDVPVMVAYWTNLSPADMALMGVDRDKLPSAAELRRSLLELGRTLEREARTVYLIWEVDGRPIGHASLKSIRRGESGEIHLHIWNAAARGRGYGAKLFALSALEFYERFALTRLVCEPKADNPMPNRMLNRAGYPRLGSRVGVSSELSAVCELNVYAIERKIAEKEATRVDSS